MKKDIVIYQGKNGEIALKGDVKQETVWASQAQIAALFDVDQSVVSRHIKNIFNDGEIDEKSNMQKMHIANSDKPIAFYSLDVILAVGYRTNSKVAIEFRKWATKTLREFITKGYVINRKQIAKNYDEFLQAVESVQKLLPAGGQVKAEDALELIKMFAHTWLSLDAYDKSLLPKAGANKKQAQVSSSQYLTFFSSYPYTEYVMSFLQSLARAYRRDVQSYGRWLRLIHPSGICLSFSHIAR